MKDLLLQELQNLRVSIDDIRKTTSETQIEIEKLKVDVKIKSAVIATIFSLVLPLVEFIRKHL
jgi:hypothetical protein